MTINDIAVEIKRIAEYAGGGHLTNKEIESELVKIANNLDEVNMELSIMLAINTKKAEINYLGTTQRGRERYLRERW